MVQIRELIYQCDQTMKAVTVSYFQLQHSISASSPVHFQTLCESSRLYEPGSSLNDYAKRLPPSSSTGSTASISSSSTPSTSSSSDQPSVPVYKFHSYYEKPGGVDTADRVDTTTSRLKSLSDSESVESGEERRTISSGDELETDKEVLSKFFKLNFILLQFKFMFYGP